MSLVEYRSDDVGAPVLTGEKGTLISLLKACLVDGYGSKASVGWTMPFISLDGNLAAFRSGAGSNQFYYHITDDGSQIDSANYGDRAAHVAGFVSMSGYNLADGSLPFKGANSPYGKIIPKSAYNNNTPSPWILIATEKYFYFTVGFFYNSFGFTSSIDPLTFQCWMSFVGDFVAFSNDPYNSCVIPCFSASAAAPSSISMGGVGTSNIKYSETPADESGVLGNGAIQTFPDSKLISKNILNNYLATDSLDSPSHPTISDVHACRFLLTKTNDLSTFRGRLPAVLLITERFPTNVSVKVIDGNNYRVLRFFGKWAEYQVTVAPSMLINIDGGDE